MAGAAAVPGASGEVQLIGFGTVLVLLVILPPGGLAQLWAMLAGWSHLCAGAPPRPARPGRAPVDAMDAAHVTEHDLAGALEPSSPSHDHTVTTEERS